MVFVLFGTYESGRQPRMAVLREGLEAQGIKAVECNEPLGIDTGRRVEMLRKPWLLAGLAVRVVAGWFRLWRRARRLPPPSAVVVGYLGALDVHLARRIWARTSIVLDQMTSLRETAEDRGSSNRTLMRVLSACDRAAVRAADVVMVDTDEHRELLPEEARSRAIVAPIGAGGAWFEAASSPEEESLRVVFYGAFTPLQGGPVIGEAIGMLHDSGAPLRFTMIGDGQDHDLTRRLARDASAVRWIPWVEASELPRLVAAHDVCLGIFGTSPKALRVVPHKVVEGAAAGCAVVTSDTPPQRRAFGEAALYVRPGDAKELARVLEMLANDREQLRAMRTIVRRLAKERLSPAAVAAPVAAAFGSPRV
ncbi:MAG TPA: glycosyltransferase [Actinomycetota bacterium]|nr:glycosyltransferase [Actinomycetota bacterium]